MHLCRLQLFFFFVLLSYVSTIDMRIVCYYTNWSVYRVTDIPILYPDKIKSLHCTHMHIAFAVINPVTLRIEPSEKHDTHYTDAFDTPLYLRMNSLKKRKSSLKILVAVGGWTAGSEAFNNILTNSSTRTLFIRHTKQFLRQWNFDGIDLDWEFPGDIERGAMNNSREQFNILIKEIHESFHNESNPFLLTAAVTADPTKIDQGYVVPDFCHYLDYVSVMTYDYYGTWDNVTGINAPLYGRNSSAEDDDDGQWKNVNTSIHYWLSKGCPANKLNLGLALYGRSFTLANGTDSVSIGTETSGRGLAGPFTKESGTLAYFEICQKLRVHNWTRVFDADAQAPYAFSSSVNSLDTQWVGYDDLQSVTVKVLHAKTLDLGGIMVWSIDQDDYSGLFCGQGEFPVIRRIHDILFSTDKNNKQNSFLTTQATKFRTKPRVSFVPIQRFTTKRQKITLTSMQSIPKSKIFNRGAKKNSPFYFLFIVWVYYLI
ncbi:unnamed protein product [Rotaria socialis]|uniref:GH18 domain-containing protein n=2 Tax=Rotaria socialis TaxID=392032 RepID=A0A818EJ45_9BILA|nr:unnamed protein product [Rotaria socialis]CAF3459935.1 unnamed protein product [Rotaria socialis]CAF3463647.1 unnamed protein product [Rotaria socialis]CAF3560914.1 unnamed protein product [Rotaria socialis]CAF4129287.1 unnamed protein product [Rotaria socialis]